MGRTPDVVLLGADQHDEPEIQVSGRHGADAFVEIGSVTKTFTAALLQSMAQAGQIGLDDPVGHHLDVESDTQISLRHLVEHTSGLPRLPPGVRVWRRDPYARVDAGAFAELVHRLPRLVRAKPGERVEYSNFGYGVLGAALTAAAGMPWIDAVRTLVVEPLDLGEDVVLEADVPPGRRLGAIDRRGTPRATWTLGPLAPAGGLWTTPRALGAYARKVLLGEALGPHPLGWQHTDGVDWHNGATRDAAVFVGASRSTRRWTVCHGFHRSSIQIDSMGLRSLEEGRP